MVTLIIIGACLWLYGWIRTFVLYAAVVATTITLILTMVAGAGFSYLFWHESVRLFQSGEFWTNMFTARESFDLWQSFFVPIIFFGDMLRITVKFVWQVPNIFSIGFFAYWCYLMYNMWYLIVLPIVLPSRKATSTNLVV